MSNMFINVVSSHLTELLKLSFSDGSFPLILKYLNILMHKYLIPVYKKNS